MLLKTYDRILGLFYENYGYMSFRQMKNEGVTELQIKELKDREILECYARGFYWCRRCGREKPSDYRYVEIGHAWPQAVICLDSAAYLHGMIEREPAAVCVATTRENRQKVEASFPLHRFYFQNTGEREEIDVIRTAFGDYRVYSRERTICDCIRMGRILPEGTLDEILSSVRPDEKQMERILAYARKLRAYRPVLGALSALETAPLQKVSHC